MENFLNEKMKRFKRKTSMKTQKNINSEINVRGSFVFYRSYYEAINMLSKKNRLLAYEAIAKYALNQEIEENLPPQVLIVLKIAMPNIDANIRNYNKRVKNNNKKNVYTFDEESEEKVLLPKRESIRIENDTLADDVNIESELDSI